MDKMFFDNWDSIVRTLVISVLAYVSMIILLRISGKRTLSKMNSFDFIVTIALGSTLATVLLNKNVALADGVLAFAILIFLQYLITWLSVRSNTLQQFIKSQPTLLFYKGSYLDKVMKDERITREELMATVRSNGISSLKEVDAVVLETDGSMTVISKITEGADNILSNVNKKTIQADK